MPKIFTDENRDEIRVKLLDKGFNMLKKGGLNAVNIGKLTGRPISPKELFITCLKVSPNSCTT